MSNPSPPFRVLVVDDNPHTRAEIKSLLMRGSERRYEFTEADTGEQALALCRAVPGPDCVILDYDLPDTNALALIADLPRARDALALPIVVLTGSDDLDLNRAVFQSGAQDFIGKDWMDAASLTRSVKNATARAEVTRQLARHAERQDLLLGITRLILANDRDEPGIIRGVFELVAPRMGLDVGHFALSGGDGTMNVVWKTELSGSAPRAYHSRSWPPRRVHRWRPSRSAGRPGSRSRRRKSRFSRPSGSCWRSRSSDAARMNGCVPATSSTVPSWTGAPIASRSSTWKGESNS